MNAQSSMPDRPSISATILSVVLPGVSKLLSASVFHVGEELHVVEVLPAHVGDLRADEDHALDTALEEHVDVVDLAHRGAGRVAEDRREAGSGRARLHRLGERREHRVAELRHEQPDRTARLDTARGDVEEVADRPLDSVSRRRADGGGAADHARGGRDANSGAVGDVS